MFDCQNIEQHSIQSNQTSINILEMTQTAKDALGSHEHSRNDFSNSEIYK